MQNYIRVNYLFHLHFLQSVKLRFKEKKKKNRIAFQRDTFSKPFVIGK